MPRLKAALRPGRFRAPLARRCGFEQALPDGSRSSTLAGRRRARPRSPGEDRHSGIALYRQRDGNLFSLEEEKGFSGPLARNFLSPVGPMAVTHDGRVFGFCGTEMAKMFAYNPRTREATNLGVAVSVMERRRYGYVFGDAVTGRDGQIIFGEDDDPGHRGLLPKDPRSRGAVNDLLLDPRPWLYPAITLLPNLSPLFRQASRQERGGSP